MGLQIDSLVTLPAKWWGFQEREEGGGVAKDCHKLSMKVLILSLSSLYPPTEIFAAKRLYFGPCKKLQLSINWWICRQTGEAHEQVLNRWGPQEAQYMQENGRNQIGRKIGTQ